MPSESLEQLMGSMENSDHVYLHQCYVRVLSHCSMDSVFAFFYSLYILYMLGLSSFQVVSIQFGTDQLQLQGAPSDHLSAFVFWYLTIKLLLAALIQWIFDLLSLSKNKNITGRISLALSLLSALLISIALSIKICFMSEWFSKFNESTISKNSNPYRLIYRILKFAKEHKYLVQRSAFTYWENEIPSRIDLGKRKYGGPFTTEDVENVRILNFLHLFKLLLSFTGLMHMVSSYFIQSGSTTLLIITPKSNFLINQYSMSYSHSGFPNPSSCIIL